MALLPSLGGHPNLQLCSLDAVCRLVVSMCTTRCWKPKYNLHSAFQNHNILITLLTPSAFLYDWIKWFDVIFTLCCSSPPSGDLDGFRKNPFVLKEGVEYRIKINFKVSVWCLSGPLAWRCYCSCTEQALSWESSAGWCLLSFAGQQGDRVRSEVHSAIIQERSKG